MALHAFVGVPVASSSPTGMMHTDRGAVSLLRGGATGSGKEVLVTGGVGYIGSHTVLELLRADYDVVIVDNLCNSNLECLERVQELAGRKALIAARELDVCVVAAFGELDTSRVALCTMAHLDLQLKGRPIGLS